MRRSVTPFLSFCLYSLALNPTISAGAEPPLPVHVASYEDIENTISIDAVIEAVNRATVSSQANGRIVEINFDVDDYVEKGSVLIRIADKQQRARVAEAEARELEAQANYNVAQKEFNRIKEVYAKKLVAKADLDKADAALKSAKERLSAATAKLKDASAELKYSVVRAPYPGVVVERHVELGELAKVGQPLMTGLSLQQLRASGSIAQRYAHYLRQAKKVSIRVDSGEQAQRLESEKVRVSPQADPQTHGFVVRADLPANLTGVYPGMFVKMEFTAGKSSHLLLPASTVVNRSELRAVYVVSDSGAVSLRQVRTGKTWQDKRVEILAGLEAGEQVALDPIQALVLLKEKPLPE